MPSTRALAADLGVARNTVADAYGQLVAEGWLATRQGSGTWVADHAPAAPAGPSEPRFRYDLRPGVPALSSFPRAAWSAAARRVLSATPYDAFGYGDPRGAAPLRAALADYLARARGVVTAPERIVVCAGFLDGLHLLCRVQRERGASPLAPGGLRRGAHRGHCGG